MIDTPDAFTVLLGVAGLLNPFALLIGAGLGWYADAPAKLFIAGFAAAALSVVLDAALHLSGVPPVGGFDGGALAVLPVRWFAGGLAAALVYWVRKKIKPQS